MYDTYVSVEGMYDETVPTIPYRLGDLSTTQMIHPEDFDPSTNRHDLLLSVTEGQTIRLVL